jgi:uncharacterized protein YlzI (FlbEa/FlbD family)
MPIFLSLKRDGNGEVVYVNPAFIVTMEETPKYTVLKFSAGAFPSMAVSEKPYEILHMIGATRPA